MIGDVVPGFYAAGECACVSVHGANRLGTNSLLDIVVFGRRGGLNMAEHAAAHKHLDIPDDAHLPAQRRLAAFYEVDGVESTAHIRKTLQNDMMDNASVVRTDESLGKALDSVRALKQRYAQAPVRDRAKVYNTEVVEHFELGFLLDMAEALVVSARARTESRGGHYREDHKLREDDHWMKHTFATRGAGGDIRLDYKDVTLGRYEPVERKY